MSNWPLLLMIVAIFIPTSIMIIAIPYLTRRIESFGVSVTEETHALAINRELRKQYAIVSGVICGLLTISMFILSAAMSMENEKWAFALVAHILALISLTFLMYLKQHFTVKRLKVENNWSQPSFTQQTIIDTSFHTKKIAYSEGWFLPQIVIALVTLSTGIFFYDRFPANLIMKYDLDGTITRTVEKSYHAVLWPVAVQCFMISIFAFTYYIILRSKQQIDASDPEASLQRNIIFRRRWSAFILTLGFAMSGLFYFIQLNMLFEFEALTINIVTFILVALTLIGTLWLSFSTGQGGSRIKINGKASTTGKTNTDQDQYWKLGQIYINPNDPALFVEKRFGIGWTVNFGRPLAWIILIGMIGIPTALLIMFTP